MTSKSKKIAMLVSCLTLYGTSAAFATPVTGELHPIYYNEAIYRSAMANDLKGAFTTAKLDQIVPPQKIVLNTTDEATDAFRETLGLPHELYLLPFPEEASFRKMTMEEKEQFIFSRYKEVAHALNDGIREARHQKNENAEKVYATGAKLVRTYVASDNIRADGKAILLSYLASHMQTIDTLAWSK